MKNEANQAGLDLLSEVKGKKDYRLYQFKECRHEQEIVAAHVRLNNFVCNQCEETARDLPSHVYLLQIKVGSFEWLKLGYAKEVENRILKYGLPTNAKVTPVRILDYATGREAHSFENSIHAKFKSYRLAPKTMAEYHTKNGFEECYPRDLKQSILKALQG